MLTLPDFREKQIVFIDTYTKKDIQFKNDNLVVKNDEEIVNQVSFYKIFTIFVMGEITVTSVLIKKAISYGIQIVLMNHNFSVYAVIGGETEGNFLLRKKQYLFDDNLNLSRILVRNKIKNQLNLLSIKRSKNEVEKETIKSLKFLSKKVEACADAKSLLGFEGTASKQFFGTYFADLNWHGRKPRTKFDELNTLLDIGYTYLFHFIDAHLRLYGFDSYQGVYHTNFYQRKSLVCDIMEPFRCIIDKTIFNAHSLNQIDLNDFIIKNHQYQLSWKKSKKYTRIFFEAIMENKEDIFLYVQQYYRNFMKGEKNYPEFLIK